MTTRRQMLLGASVGILGAAGLRLAAAQSNERVIQISARKFQFTPALIKLKRGQAVVLELTTADVLMGFSAPDFGVRADIIPGKVQRLRIVPDKQGEFIFLCDVFCGSGHEDMSGKLIVEA